MTTWYKYALVILTSMIVWQGSLVVTYADEYVVTRLDDPNPDGCQTNGCSLREAVIAANNRVGADTITFQATSGDYQLQIVGMDEDASATGDLDVLDDLSIKGKGKNNTRINGLSGTVNVPFTTDRIFHILSGNFTLSGVTIRGGNVTRTPASEVGDDGGGIAYQATGKILSIIDTQIISNSGRFGGGVFNNGQEAIINIVNSTIAQNNATSKGGGVNTSQVSAADLNILGSAIMSNTTGEDGGGIYFFSAPRAGEKVVMSIINTTISGNSAGFSGGAIANDGSGEINLQNSTIVNNIAATIEGGGGTGGGLASLGGKFNVSNSIIAKNTDYSQVLGSDTYAPDCSAKENTTVMNSLSHNLIGDNTGCNWPTTGDDLVGTELNKIDPKLGALKTTNSSTLFYPLQTGSPAINMGGTTVGGQLGACTFIDQQGFSRKVALPCDIGSYESGTNLITVSLTVIKSGPDIIDQLGDTITYTLVAINSSLVTATHVSITDEVPIGAFYARGGDKFDGKVVSWFNGPAYEVMPSNSLIAVTFTVTSNQAIRNETYQVNADGFGSGGFTGVGTGLAEPSLFIGKTAPPRASKQELITYTLTVRNDGKAEAVDVVITDTVPTGATYISGGTLEGQLVKWELPSLAADGGAATVSFVVTTTKTITNTHYRVSAMDVTRARLYSQTGTIAVVTQVGANIYLPVILQNWKKN